MKFFTKFGSCLGGATISPVVEADAGGWMTEDQVGTRRQSRIDTRQAKVTPRRGASSHWKPALNAISENSPLAELDRRGANQPAGGGDGKKPPLKAKSKSPARAAPPQFHGDEHWYYFLVILLSVITI